MFRAANAHHQDGQIVLIHHPVPDDVLIKFGPPDDEHLLLETCRGINGYNKKECIKLVITQKMERILFSKQFI
jgi:hypothetical protein